MKPENRTTPVAAIIAILVLAFLGTIGCATQTHPSDRMLWEGIDDPSTNAPATNAPVTEP